MELEMDLELELNLMTMQDMHRDGDNSCSSE